MDDNNIYLKLQKTRMITLILLIMVCVFSLFLIMAIVQRNDYQKWYLNERSDNNVYEECIEDLKTTLNKRDVQIVNLNNKIKKLEMQAK